MFYRGPGGSADKPRVLEALTLLPRWERKGTQASELRAALLLRPRLAGSPRPLAVLGPPCCPPPLQLPPPVASGSGSSLGGRAFPSSRRRLSAGPGSSHHRGGASLQAWALALAGLSTGSTRPRYLQRTGLVALQHGLPRPGIGPALPCLGRWVRDRWTTREAPR